MWLFTSAQQNGMQKFVLLWNNGLKTSFASLAGVCFTPLSVSQHCLTSLSHNKNIDLQVIEECVMRLDVAMFNGILRDSEDDPPTDPLADPITDLSVLPIPIGGLTFGAGSHLKNVVSDLIFA